MLILLSSVYNWWQLLALHDSKITQISRQNNPCLTHFPQKIYTKLILLEKDKFHHKKNKNKITSINKVDKRHFWLYFRDFWRHFFNFRRILIYLLLLCLNQSIFECLLYKIHRIFFLMFKFWIFSKISLFYIGRYLDCPHYVWKRKREKSPGKWNCFCKLFLKRVSRSHTRAETSMNYEIMVRALYIVTVIHAG